jgi:hypothetical protein
METPQAGEQDPKEEREQKELGCKRRIFTLLTPYSPPPASRCPQELTHIFTFKASYSFLKDLFVWWKNFLLLSVAAPSIHAHHIPKLPMQ